MGGPGGGGVRDVAVTVALPMSITSCPSLPILVLLLALDLEQGTRSLAMVRRDGTARHTSTSRQVAGALSCQIHGAAGRPPSIAPPGLRMSRGESLYL